MPLFFGLTICEKQLKQTCVLWFLSKSVIETFAVCVDYESCVNSWTHHTSPLQWHGEFRFTNTVMSIYSSIRKYVQHENWGFVIAPGSCNVIYSSCSSTPEAVALSCLTFITLHKLSFRTGTRGGVRNVDIKQSGQWYHPFSNTEVSFVSQC